MWIFIECLLAGEQLCLVPGELCMYPQRPCMYMLQPQLLWVFDRMPCSPSGTQEHVRLPEAAQRPSPLTTLSPIMRLFLTTSEVLMTYRASYHRPLRIEPQNRKLLGGDFCYVVSHNSHYWHRSSLVCGGKDNGSLVPMAYSSLLCPYKRGPCAFTSPEIQALPQAYLIM